MGARLTAPLQTSHEHLKLKFYLRAIVADVLLEGPSKNRESFV